MADGQINLPSGFGGLLRFQEEYESMFNFRPSYVIIFIALIVAFRIFLGIYY